ncbi:MAG: ABC transporter ATP-binding protein [Ignavibacteria bacterium]|nr:ABC transporter ATP-binding protein [Ignavibacteria bacterium]MBK7445700.1 ABC transporter ATP-binding protein [Ignavibacteria bacterium]MBK8382405.1 ABC transporter ATP-binding protein [Ignavibacteria bacterium]MBK9404261.1 ABC transporter ATP-binding protein [Ignavibacteria bacterium]
MSVVIKADKVSKLYRLGVISSKTLSQDFNRFLARLRGKEDPYLKIGALNSRDIKNENDFVFALKDISFEINKGEIVGIIGKNGAGKSTLLKILSRVTTPSTGNLKVKGRIASLLEVGTGFHQELTGRENIYLNGSILGMSKKEITGKFDEIVDFSGVETYIDTPVKRYSSGMYVRLAFAVAAHLEPEILIVDEVLAVGDAEFQKKCLGKMQEVSSRDGRTILFVSHNMGAISSLCTSAILLEKGLLKSSGSTDNIISQYLTTENSLKPFQEFEDQDTEVYFKKIAIHSDKEESASNELDVRFPVTIKFSYKVKNFINGTSIAFSIYSKSGTKLFYSSVKIDELLENIDDKTGAHTAEVTIPGYFLTPGSYFINASLQIENIQMFDFKEGTLHFEIIESGTSLHKFKGKDIGLVLVDLEWKNSVYETAL